jgi:integrase
MEEDFSRFLSIKLGLAPSTIINHGYKLRLFLIYLKDNRLKMTPDACESYIYYLKEKGLKPATLNVYIDLFVALDKYYKDRKQPIDISSGFKRYTIVQRHIELLTIDEIEKLTTTPMKLHHPHPLWEEMDKMYLLFTSFLAYTGCRYQEGQDQVVKNFDMATGKVLIPKSKNGSYRYVYLPLEVLERFRPILKNKAPDDLVFTTNKGIKIFDSNFLANLRKASFTVWN